MTMESLIFVFTACVCLFVNAERDCTTILDKEARCVPLDECEPLKSLVDRRNKSAFALLKKYNCGYDQQDPLVCCPHKVVEMNVALFNGSECTTPDGSIGECIEWKECTHIYNQYLNKEFVSEESMDYIKKAKCTPSQPTKSFTICCEHHAANRLAASLNMCSLTALPPSDDSACCGFESSSEVRVFGGIAASIDQFPWLALIDYTRPDIHCGGSLISGKYVLTAAHCLMGRKRVDLQAVSVRLGEYNTTNSGPDCTEVPGGGIDCTDGHTSVDIESYVVHKDYDPDQVYQYHDIALIRLKETVNYTDFIRPICLPTSDFTLSPSDDLKLFVSGWGFYDQTRTPSTIKLYSLLPYVGAKMCQNRYAGNGKQTLIDSQICVGGEYNKDVCEGDSGGPLMIQTRSMNFQVVGVVSFGPGDCGLENWPSIYTKVYDHIDWIRDNIKP